MLARKVARWTTDNAERLPRSDPEMPAGIINREADNWRPLLAIADVAGGGGRSARRGGAGGHMPALEDDAASGSSCCSATSGTRSTATRSATCLAERRDRVGRSGRGPGRASKAAHGRSSARAASRSPRTSSLGCSSRSASRRRRSDRGKRAVSGYIRAHFKEAFDRYLGSEGGSQPDNRTECDEIRTSDISQPDTQDPGVSGCKMRETQ